MQVGTRHERLPMSRDKRSTTTRPRHTDTSSCPIAASPRIGLEPSQRKDTGSVDIDAQVQEAPRLTPSANPTQSGRRGRHIAPHAARPCRAPLQFNWGRFGLPRYLSQPMGRSRPWVRGTNYCRQRQSSFVRDKPFSLPTAHACPGPSYSTVTDLARLRGLSTSVPRITAVW